MFKNRFILILGVISLMMVTVAVSRPVSTDSIPGVAGANDFYQRHPDWKIGIQSGVFSVTAPLEASDYFQRHSELSSGLNASAQGPSGRVPLDECFDVSLSEAAACRAASESTSP